MNRKIILERRENISDAEECNTVEATTTASRRLMLAGGRCPSFYIGGSLGGLLLPHYQHNSLVTHSAIYLYIQQ